MAVILNGVCCAVDSRFSAVTTISCKDVASLSELAAADWANVGPDKTAASPAPARRRQRNRQFLDSVKTRFISARLIIPLSPYAAGSLGKVKYVLANVSLNFYLTNVNVSLKGMETNAVEDGSAQDAA